MTANNQTTSFEGNRKSFPHITVTIVQNTMTFAGNDNSIKHKTILQKTTTNKLL